MRRAIAVLASFGLAAGTITLAAPAAVSLDELTIEVNSGLAISPSGTLKTSVGSRVVIENKSGGDITVLSDCDALPFGIPGSPRTPETVLGNASTSISSNSAATCQVAITGGGANTTVTIIIEGSDDPNSSSGGRGSAPAPVVQQFGLPASGNCEDGYSDSMNWSGVGNGGWGISWAQWVNDGVGGAVCSRTVMYDTSTAKWTVN